MKLNICTIKKNNCKRETTLKRVKRLQKKQTYSN